MHYLLLTVLGSIDHRNPRSEGGNVLPSAEPGLLPLYPHSVGKLSSHVLHNHLEASDLTVSELRHAPWSQKPAPPPRGSAYQGVCEGNVFSMGPYLIDRLGVSFHELVQ